MKKPNVLVADDYREILDAVVDALRDSGVEHFVVAHNGLQAIQLIQDNLDLTHVITDYNMPVTNGLEVIRQARILLPKATLVLMSGSFERHLREIALQSGADYFFQKLGSEALPAELGASSPSV